MICQMVEHHFGEPQTAKLWPHVHALDFAILGAEELDAATAGRHAVMPDEKEYDRRRNQLFYSIAVTAFGWIERGQVRFKLSNQALCVGTVRAFPGDDRWHRMRPQGYSRLARISVVSS